MFGVTIYSLPFNAAAQAVQFGAITTTGTDCLMDNQDNATMEIYAEDGTLESKRPLMPEERQLSIISANRTGTFDNVSEPHYLMKILKK